MLLLVVMVRVSKNKLPEKIERKLVKQLGSLVVAQQRSRDSENLIFDLFTPAERTVFIKRVGIIALLARGYSHRSIGSALHVSDTTVDKIAHNLAQGKYKTIVTNLRKKEHRESVLGILESILTLGLPGQPQKRLRKQIRDDIEAWKAGA